LVATIAFWDYFLDWLGYHVPKVKWLIRPSPLVLIKAGRINKQDLQKEMITEDELIAQLREQGVETVDGVKLSYLEGDGHISVIKKDEHSEPKKKSTRL
jgi:uncharacterized membrane protein YcaP (DUF421 family)